MHATVREVQARPTKGRPPHAARFADDEPHVLIAAADAKARYTIAGQLLEAGYRVTTAGSFGVIEILLEDGEEFDLVIAAEADSSFAMSRLARSLRPTLPMVLIDPDAASGSGVLTAVQVAMARWPVRQPA